MGANFSVLKIWILSGPTRTRRTLIDGTCFSWWIAFVTTCGNMCSKRASLNNSSLELKELISLCDFVTLCTWAVMRLRKESYWAVWSVDSCETKTSKTSAELRRLCTKKIVSRPGLTWALYFCCSFYVVSTPVATIATIATATIESPIESTSVATSTLTQQDEFSISATNWRLYGCKPCSRRVYVQNSAVVLCIYLQKKNTRKFVVFSRWDMTPGGYLFTVVLVLF